MLSTRKSFRITCAPTEDFSRSGVVNLALEAFDLLAQVNVFPLQTIMGFDERRDNDCASFQFMRIGPVFVIDNIVLLPRRNLIDDFSPWTYVSRSTVVSKSPLIWN